MKYSTFSEPGKDLAKSVSTIFFFKTKEDVQGNQEEWTVRNFYHVPIAAITATLSNLQA